MTGTYNFSGVYVDPASDNTDSSVVLTLDTSSMSEDAAATEVATGLQRMSIDWLRPLARPNGPWRLDRYKFASFFSLTDRQWLVGEHVLRPVYDRRETAGKLKTLVKFIVAPDGPLQWAHGAQVNDSGWSAVDRLRGKVQAALETAVAGDDYQHVGLLSRDLTITAAQLVYNPVRHPPTSGVQPGPADAKRMLSDYFGAELGEDRKEFSNLARAVTDFALHLQHKRTATFGDAAMCAAGTLALVDILRILYARDSAPV